MDPVTALAMVVKALAEMITEIVKGQDAAQKQKMWDWYIADVARWRKLLKLDP